MKAERRQARRARQASVKQEFASAVGVDDVRELRGPKANLAKSDARVARGACVFCGQGGHWKKECMLTKENRPFDPVRARRGHN
eukprot:2064489-Rhodomonas_salina.1